MSETKLFEELLCLEIFQEEGGVASLSTFLGTFLLKFGHFQEGRGGYLIPKRLWNFSAYVLDIFEERGGST